MSFNRKEEEVMVYRLWDSMTCFHYFGKNGVAARRARAAGKMGDWGRVKGRMVGLQERPSERGQQ